MTLKELRQKRQGRHGAGSLRKRTAKQRRAISFTVAGRERAARGQESYRSPRAVRGERKYGERWA